MISIRAMEAELNLGNSLFAGLNEQHGVMLCGYEWGTNCDEETAAQQVPDAIYTFANKTPRFGEIARTWPYDRKVAQLFAAWGHPLDDNGLGGPFEQSIVQTNWCDSEGHHVDGSYAVKLLHALSINNFMRHTELLRPKVLLFFGIRQLEFLQHETVLPRFSALFGAPHSPPQYTKKPFAGRRFKVGFQQFDQVQVVAFPHPSGSHGLSPSYLALFKEEMDPILADYKRQRGLAPVAQLA